MIARSGSEERDHSAGPLQKESGATDDPSSMGRESLAEAPIVARNPRASPEPLGNDRGDASRRADTENSPQSREEQIAAETRTAELERELRLERVTREAKARRWEYERQRDKSFHKHMWIITGAILLPLLVALIYVLSVFVFPLLSHEKRITMLELGREPQQVQHADRAIVPSSPIESPEQSTDPP